MIWLYIYIYILIDWTWWFSSSLREKNHDPCVHVWDAWNHDESMAYLFDLFADHLRRETYGFPWWFSTWICEKKHGFPWKNTWHQKSARANVQGDFAGEGQDPWNHWCFLVTKREGKNDKYQRTWCTVHIIDVCILIDTYNYTWIYIYIYTCVMWIVYLWGIWSVSSSSILVMEG